MVHGQYLKAKRDAPNHGFSEASDKGFLLVGTSVRLFNYLITGLFAYFLTGCANPIAPTGGAKDETPPKLIAELSTPNMQTRFTKQTIQFFFDEWVELKDAFNQVIVSPPLEFRPSIARKKKSIQFEFDEREILRDSATYVINFGKAIKDLTEGNVAEIVFVFSTGDYIDSLTVEGEIIDAFTAEPVEDVLFMLYENLADSVFKKERPFYFARTDENGKFKVNNVKAGRFKGVALVDANLNYRFDNAAEEIAFLEEPIIVGEIDSLVLFDSLQLDTVAILNDSLPIPDSAALKQSTINKQQALDTVQIDSIVISADSLPTLDSTAQKQSAINNQQPLTLRLFEEEKSLFLQEDDAETYGIVKLGFNRKPYEAVVSFDSIGQLTYLESDKDSLKLWYSLEADVPFKVFVKMDTLIDTIEVESGLKEEFYKEAELEPVEKEPTRLPVQTPADPFGITFNHPLFSIDETLVRVFEDSLKNQTAAKIKIDSLDKRKLSVMLESKEDMRYEVEFAPGSLLDIFGLSNADTIRRAWLADAEKEYGTLHLKVKRLRPDLAYVVRLLAKDDVPFKIFTTRDSTEFQTSLKYIPPAIYSLEVVEDLDFNGRWTTGNYNLQRQPERVQRTVLEEVRANWDVDAEVEWNPNVVKRKPESSAPGQSGTGPPSGPGRSGGSQRN